MLPADADLERWFAEADDLRGRWRSTGVPMHERRPELLAALTRLYAGHDPVGNTAGEARR
jgi:hypothetical protein